MTELEYARSSATRKKENTMNRLLLGLLALAGTALWLFTGANLHSAPQRPSSPAQYLEGDAYQKARAFSPAVITRGGRNILFLGQTSYQQINSKELPGDLHGHAPNGRAHTERT